VRIILPDKSIHEYQNESVRIEHLLGILGINPVEVLTIKNGRVVPEDTLAEGDDEIRILRITHGG
jgi:sulfur carrier protein ThiS